MIAGDMTILTDAFSSCFANVPKTDITNNVSYWPMSQYTQSERCTNKYAYHILTGCGTSLDTFTVTRDYVNALPSTVVVKVGGG
jgi:hypothetical protein